MQVISTAGHVDHGKSTLVKRLTGIDPDRLLEEKERGLTIDLGFAWMRLPSGREIGIVDVPGHERFIHNMLAGVGPVSVTLFVVAANEGWREQSEEHLAIVDLLGARAGVVAITKADLVDDLTLEATAAQVRERLASTTLAGSEIVPVSGVTGHGCDILAAALDRAIDHVGEPADRGRPRVFIDRCFTVKGVGTVITGTLAGGTLKIDDPVVVLPSGVRSRVRAIQTHKRVLDVAAPVSRVAINLAGVSREQVHRGDAVVLPSQWQPSSDLDVELRVPATTGKPLTSRGAFKAYLGSAEVDVRMTLFDAEQIDPGGRAFARLMLSNPVVTAPQDRFVLRDVGRRMTVAGGVVLDAHPPALRGTARELRPRQLEVRARTSPDELPAVVIAERGVVPRADLAWLSGSERLPVSAVSLRTLEVAPALFEALARRLEQVLAEFHEREPLLQGMPREEARAAAGVKSTRLFGEMLEVLEHRITAEGPLLRLPGHRVVIDLDADRAHARLVEQVRGAGFQPPGYPALVREHGDRLVDAMIAQGGLVRVSPDIVFTSEQIEEAKQLIADTFHAEGPLTASRIRDLLGTSRKYAIPLLEHLDAAGFTRREGDLRTLAQPAPVGG